MYKKSDFIVDATEKVAKVHNKFEYTAWNVNIDTFINDVTEIVNIINEIAVTELGYRGKLNYKLEYSFEPIGTKDTFTSVVIYIESLENIGLYNKFNFSVNHDADIYNVLIKGILGYYERVEKGFKLQANLDEFNALIANLMKKNAVQAVKNRLEQQLEEEEVDFDSIESKTSLAFGLGHDFLDISELHAVIGLSEEVIMNLGSNAIFDTVFPGRAEASRKEFAKVLDVYVQPYGLIKVNDVRTKDLGIYTREDLHTVMRRSFSTPLSKLERGLGYFETQGENGILAIIEKKAIKESDMKETSEDLIYIDNLSMTEEEAKQGLNMLEISFRIYPFYKNTDEPAADTLTEIWNSLKN